jgi:hypothetical protein
MMGTIELRDREAARAFLLQGLLLSCLSPPPEGWHDTLALAEEVAGAHPLPSLGFLTDLSHVLFAGPLARESRTASQEAYFPVVRRVYEDYVVGKLHADVSIERAGDALRRYRGRDRNRGLAFVVEQMRQRCGLMAVSLSPAYVKGLLREPPEHLCRLAEKSLADQGPSPVLPKLYESLVAAFRRAGHLLGQEDLFELDHGTALQELGQRVALRQVLTAAEMLLAESPRPPARLPGPRRDVATRLLEEDTYPVGGYSSLSTKGSIESLLFSQLAFMEPDRRPDLFDIKFLRDELLYYSRDDNRFLRRRRTFVFALFPDLVRARVKDEGLPWQRIILALALLVAAVRRLTEWLTNEALRFEVCFVEEDGHAALADERRLLEILLREPLASGMVCLTRAVNARQVEERCAEYARRSWCNCLTISTGDQALVPEAATVASLVVGQEPELLGIEGGGGDWPGGLSALLAAWV